MWRRVAVKARIGRGQSHLFAAYADNVTHEVFEVARVAACGLPDLRSKATVHWADELTCNECARALARGAK